MRPSALISFFLLFFSFSSIAFGANKDEPLASASPPPKQVKHSIEGLWLTHDARGCLVQLNTISADQQSCIALWKKLNGRSILILSTRVPFSTNESNAPVMVTIISEASLLKAGESGHYKAYRVRGKLLDWTLNGGDD